MRGTWYVIAKAEFFVLTSRFKHRRYLVVSGALALSVLWALFLVPSIVSLVLGWFGSGITIVLMTGLPGFMRSFVLFLWIVFLFYPISYSLQELKIGQWEIMLSNNVSTKAIMLGTFAGKIPLYSLGVFLLSPLIISPYAIIYHVSHLGQLIMYFALIFVAVSTLWVSNLICTVIQAKLGESPRGNDLARALSMIVGLATLLPMYGIFFLAAAFAEFMGLNLFLAFPFTWGADLITWIIISFNGIGLSASNIVAFEAILGFGPMLDLTLMIMFAVGTVAIALVTADRLFRIEAGKRNERVTTIGKENILLRGIRRFIPGSFGILLVTALKDFTRKTQNTSKAAFGVVLAILFPLMINISGISSDDPGIIAVYSAMSAGIMLAMIGAMTFGGVGFLDSQDQLWILKSAPKGVTKYVRARIAESLIFALPMAVIATTIISLLTGLQGLDALFTLVNASLAVTGATFLSTGVTANNPTYDDTQSKSFKDNTGFCMLIIMMMTLMAIPFGAITGFKNLHVMIIAPNATLLLLGLLFTNVGTRRLARPE